MRFGRTSFMPSVTCSAGRGISMHQTATAVHSLLVEELDVYASSGPAEGCLSKGFVTRSSGSGDAGGGGVRPLR